jgi:hypothetical protein
MVLVLLYGGLMNFHEQTYIYLFRRQELNISASSDFDQPPEAQFLNPAAIGPSAPSDLRAYRSVV